MNKKAIALGVSLLIAGTSFTGCAPKTLSVSQSTTTPDEVVEVVEITDEDAGTGEEGSNVDAENSSDSEESIEGKIKSRLSGLYYEEFDEKRRPVVVMLDNHIAARPQSGLSEAEVVYEILAEGLITRYMAVFYADEPTFVGPIRSARSYFIDKALEYDAMYAHVGGSPQAFDDLVRLNVADLDGLRGNGMYRTSKTGKKAPHNTYSSIDALREAGLRNKYREEGNFEFFEFYDKDTSIEGDECKYVKITYKSPTSSDKTGYYSEYKYDEELNAYYRYVNGQKHVDESNKEPLKAKNIIVQIAKQKVIDNEGRLDVKTVGTGEGYLITNGEKISVTWEKKDRRDRTRFYDVNGNEIKLNPGVTWFQVAADSTKLGW